MNRKVSLFVSLVTMLLALLLATLVFAVPQQTAVASDCWWTGNWLNYDGPCYDQHCAPTSDKWRQYYQEQCCWDGVNLDCTYYLTWQGCVHCYP